jgi:type IV secretory pathway TraG/TraD family ATPase VirD4
MTNTPPSLRRQDWTGILLIASLTFFFGSSMLLYHTWHIGSPWGHFSVHMPDFGEALIDLVLYRSLDSWRDYWQLVTERNLQYHFAAHTMLPLFTASYMAFRAARFVYIPGGRDGLRHICGARLYCYKTAHQHAKQQLKKEQQARKQLGLNLHPDIQIPRNRESGNICVVGAQGTGKTVYISPLIHQVIQRGERAFIYDEKREFTALFYHVESCLLIAPWDERSQAWNIQADANSAPRAQLIAERLIPDSNDPLWSNGARMILAGMIEILNHTQSTWGWAELAKVLSEDEETLNNQLTQYYPRAARFIAKDSKTTQSFFAQLIGSLGWIFTLAQAWPRAYENGFSMTEWVNQVETDKPVILVQADKRYKDIGAPIANALIAIMTANLLSQTNSSQRELWLFLDELANLPRNDSLMEWMSLGRSKGARIVAGTQSISQLKQLYTDHGADTLLNMFTVFASMRVGGAGETASYTAKAFGEREVERPSNAPEGQGKASVNWQHETLALVTPSDIVQLPQANNKGVEGFLLIPGWKAVYRLRWPYPTLSTQAPEHCPATWLSSDSQPPSKETDKTLSRREQLQARRQHAINECDQ